MSVARTLAAFVVVALALAAASSAARGPEKGPGKRVVPGELIVVFERGVGESRRDRALERAGVREERALTRDGRVKLVRGPARASQRALKRLSSDPAVAYAEPNFVVRALATPNDSSFGELWGLVNTGQTVDGVRGTADADIDADAAWDVSTGSASVTVGVIDTGVDFSHPELAGVSWVNQGEDCTGCRTNGVDDDGNGYVDDWRGWDFVSDDNDPFDDHGHGTHVAGTIGALGDNGTGVAGVNWNVRVAALKFLDGYGSGTTADAIRALDYATANGIAITNNSWGGGGYSQALLDAIERAGAAGGLVVAAAGNDGSDNDALPSYPASYDSRAILSVAATDSSDGLASFSNYGAVSVDLGAPGVSIYSTLPGGGYDWWSGTSMATPHVAGTAALVKAAFPGATAMGTKALLLRTVDPKSSLAGTATGGRLNAGSAATCSAAPKVWIEEPLAGFEAVAGEALDVVALGANCADPAGVTVTATANGSSFTLAHRGDGLYTGSFTPTATGSLAIEVAGTVGAATDARSVAGTVAENYRISEEPFAWVDATAGGTKAALNVDDGDVTVSLPFSFALYGTSFTSAKISSNGYLVFGSSGGTYWSNTDLPSTADPNGIVAPFWDDLRLSSRGEVWYRTVGTSPNRRFVVSWIGAPHYYDVGDSTFQVVLEEGSGDVVFQYRDVVFGEPGYDYGASATVGLESVDGARARVFSFDESSLAPYEGAKAIRFGLGPADTVPPAAPTGLTAVGGELEVVLDWADNGESDLARYRVYRDGARVGETSASDYADTAVTAGTAYAYTVTAVDASGNESGPSAEATATPSADTTAPAAPAGLSAAAGETSVALDWPDNAEDDLDGYRVYRDGVEIATATGSAYTDSGLTAGTTYAYHVTALDASGNESAASPSASATPTGDVTAPAAPTGLTASGGNGQVALDWGDNGEPDLAGYHVYRDGARVASTTASAYTDTAVANGTTYTYRVTAYDGAGNESAASGSASATPREATTVATYRPDGYAVLAGSTSSGSLASLYDDDGSRLEISKSGSLNVADFYARASVGTAPLSSLRRVAVTWNGHATHRNVRLTLSVYDWRTASWRVVQSTTGVTGDTTFSWADTSSPGDFFSATGEVRFRVHGERDGGLKTRTDLIRFTIEY